MSSCSKPLLGKEKERKRGGKRMGERREREKKEWEKDRKGRKKGRGEVVCQRGERGEREGDSDEPKGGSYVSQPTYHTNWSP